MALVGVRPCPVEHILAVRMGLQVQRHRAGKRAALPQASGSTAPSRCPAAAQPVSCSACRNAWESRGWSSGQRVPIRMRRLSRANRGSGRRCAFSFCKWPDDIVAAMRIAIGQINCTVGDLSGNARKILDFADRAKARRRRSSAHPGTLAVRLSAGRPAAARDFCAACERALADTGSQSPRHQRRRRASAPGRTASSITPLRCCRTAASLPPTTSSDLPNYTVFDEERYFESDAQGLRGRYQRRARRREHLRGRVGCGRREHRPRVAEHGRRQRRHQHLRRYLGAGSAEAVRAQPARRCCWCSTPRRFTSTSSRPATKWCANAAPKPACRWCSATWWADRTSWCSTARRSSWTRRGKLTHQLPAFEEASCLRRHRQGRPGAGRDRCQSPRSTQSIYKALCLGVRDYVGKNGFPGALLGLSGGIDSALTLCIAADALGADKVHAVMMPSQFTADMSGEDARAMAKRTRRALQRDRHQADVRRIHERAQRRHFGDRPFDATEENLQSRIRGTLLMAMSNKSARSC